MIVPSYRDLFIDDPVIRRDYVIHKTASIRNSLFNIYNKIKHKKFGGVEGHVQVRVRRAKYDKNGKPILDQHGNYVYERDWYNVEKHKHNLLTTNGRDWVHEQLWTNAAAGSAEQAAHEIALTVDATGADAADDALPGEITTGGLGKKNADTVTHTDNTNTTTLVTTWTASATHTAVQMAGTFFNPTASTGQLVLENTFTSTNLASGDSIELTWTITTG